MVESVQNHTGTLFFCLKINNFDFRILNFEFIFRTFAPENPESVGLRLLIN